MPAVTDDPLIPGIDSYVSVDAANNIASKRLFADAWTNAIASTQAKALQTATSLLDRFGWSGEPKLLGQPLAWPRVGLRDARGCELPADLLPESIATATVELAIWLLGNGQIAAPAVQMRQLGDAMTMYFPTVADELPKHVRRLIEPFLRVASANNAEVKF